MEIRSKKKSGAKEVDFLLNNFKFEFPKGFREFYLKNDGAYIVTESKYIELWTLDEMETLNKEYLVHEYIPEYYFFGTDGGGMGFAIQKQTGLIFEIPFIGMFEFQKFLCKTFDEFLNWI